MTCPRCDTRLVISYDERKCIMCGWIDINYLPPRDQERKDKMSKLDSFIHTSVKYSPGRPRKTGKDVNSAKENFRIINLSNEGFSNKEIAEFLEISEIRIEYVLKGYKERGALV